MRKIIAGIIVAIIVAPGLLMLSEGDSLTPNFFGMMYTIIAYIFFCCTKIGKIITHWLLINLEK